MDLLQKYFDHQNAVLKSSAAADLVRQRLYFDRAAIIAEEIEQFQLESGAAAANGWGLLRQGVATDISTAPIGQEGLETEKVPEGGTAAISSSPRKRRSNEKSRCTSYVVQENILHFTRLLEIESDPERRDTLLGLLQKEREKDV